MLDIGTEILHHHVRTLDHPQQHPTPVGMFEVQRHAALVRVDVLEVDPVALAGAVVERIERFDFDDLRAHLAQLTNGGRPRAGAREIDDFDV